MKTVRLGKTGLEVSRICFGCMSFGKQTDERPWVLGLDEARPMFKRATTDRYNKTMYEKTGDRDIVDAVEAVAKTRNTSMAQVAMAWVLQKPVVTSPIVGVSKMSHLEDAIAAADLGLTADEIEKLEAPYKPQHVAGF